MEEANVDAVSSPTNAAAASDFGKNGRPALLPGYEILCGVDNGLQKADIFCLSDGVGRRKGPNFRFRYTWGCGSHAHLMYGAPLHNVLQGFAGRIDVGAKPVLDPLQHLGKHAVEIRPQTCHAAPQGAVAGNHENGGYRQQ